jgi:inosine-uridine nucleoside N-ribohydrolase
MNKENPQREFRTAQDPWYPYQDKRVPYRSESFFIASSELATLSQRLADDKPSEAPARKPIIEGAPNLIFDTDIGTDIDDSLALLMLLNIPKSDYQLLGITTVYGYSHLRAAVAERIVRAYEKSQQIASPIPVIAGESTPLGTHRPVWHTGTEGLDVLTDEEIESLEAKADFVVANGLEKPTIPEQGQADSRHKAAQFIIEQSHKYPGELTIIGLGALTNIAMALAIDPSLAKRVKRLVYMGLGSRVPEQELPDLPFQTPGRSDPISSGSGLPWFHHPNHNISSDVSAAVHVFQSGMSIDVIPHVITGQLWWGQGIAGADNTRELEEARDACLSLLEATAPQESVIVSKLLSAWLEYRSVIFRTIIRGTCPHDALTTAEAVYPGRFVEFTEPGHVLIHEWAGFATFVCGSNGPHRLGKTNESTSFLRFLSERLMPEASNYEVPKTEVKTGN